ncbi:MAG: hypothetical protein ACLFQI_12400 [Halochromatium sp.]|uniref:hypothetical protein n=1 Tax=Halochromatium sp. TaxID=2049430 RepID=UPI0039792492
MSQYNDRSWYPPAAQSPSQSAHAQMTGGPMGADQGHSPSYAPQPPGMMPAGGYHAGYYPAAYQPAPMAPQAGMSAGVRPGGGYPTPATQPFFNLGNDRFLKGLLIGAAAAYLLTNEGVQRTAIKGAVKLWGGLQGGVEELKERFHDAEAEIQAAESHKDA